VLAAGVLFNGGDAPPATFLIRLSLFSLGAWFVLRRAAVVLRPTAPDLLVLGFWLVEAVGLSRGGYDWIAYQWFLHHTAVVALYLLLRARGPEGDGRSGSFALFLLAAALFEAAFGIIQHHAFAVGRPEGTLQNPNFLAECLVYGVAAAACVPFRSPLTARMRSAWLPAAIALLLYGVWLTRSRSGFLVAAFTAAYLLARRFGTRRVAAGALLAAALFVAIPNPLMDRFLGKGDPFAFDRLLMWKSAWRMAEAHPFGVGVGQFKYHWFAFRLPADWGIARYAKDAWNPHSELFSVLSELGFPGALLFAGLIAVGALSLRRLVRRDEPGTVCAVLVLVVSGFHSLIDFNYHVMGLLMINATALSIVSGRLWKPLFEREVRLAGMVRWTTVAMLALMAAYSAATWAGSVAEGRGDRALASGRGLDAQRAYEAAARIDPWKATAPAATAALLSRRFDSDGRVEWLASAIEAAIEAEQRNPLDFRNPERLGQLYAKVAGAEKGDRFRGAMTGAALRSYGRAIALNPHAAGLRYRRALLLGSAGLRDESRRAAIDMLVEEPTYAKGWVLLGDLRADDRNGMAAAYARALALRATLAPEAGEPYEKEFFDFDAAAVARRLAQLRREGGS
jgi:hypothetical protein